MRTHWSDRVEPPPGLIKLNSNETVDTALNVHLSRFLDGITAQHITKYPDIKQAYLSLSELTRIPSDQIYLTSGADQAIRNLIHSLDIKQMNIHVPTFELCEVYCNLYDIKVMPSDYVRVDDMFIRSPVTNSESIYVVAPDSITGATVTQDQIYEMCDKHKHVILDETYSVHDNKWLPAVHKYDNLYIVRSFSKTGGIAGLRVGYIHSSKKNIDALYQWRPMFEINSIAAEYLKYISMNKHIIKASHDSIQLGKQILQNCLRSVDCSVFKTHGNYVLTNYNDELDERLSRVCTFRLPYINEVPYMRITSASPDVIRLLTNEIQR